MEDKQLCTTKTPSNNTKPTHAPRLTEQCKHLESFLRLVNRQLAYASAYVGSSHERRYSPALVCNWPTSQPSATTHSPEAFQDRFSGRLWKPSPASSACSDGKTHALTSHTCRNQGRLGETGESEVDLSPRKASRRGVTCVWVPRFIYCSPPAFQGTERL